MIGAPLGMADNDGAGAGVGQHFRRNIAGMGARRPWDGNPARRSPGLLSRAPCRQRPRSASPAGKPADRPCRSPWARPRSWPRIRPSRPCRPFIFQLPAISGRMASVMSEFPRNVWLHQCASRGRRARPDRPKRRLRPLTVSIGPRRSRLRRGGCHFMMLYQLGDALLRNSISNSLGRDPVPSCQTSWTHASRNAESLIKLARQNHHGRGDGRVDHQFRRLGHRRHLQGVRTVDAGQGRPYRDFDRTIPPALYRQAAADRPPVRPPVDDGSGPRLRPRPPGAAADHRGSGPRRGSAAAGARPVRRRNHAHDLQRSQFQGRQRRVRSGPLPGHDPAVRLHRSSATSPTSGGCRCGVRSPARSRPASNRRRS